MSRDRMPSPWRRAPRLLLGEPLVLAALVAATAILVVASASAPLYLASVRTAAVHARAAQRCPQYSQPGITPPPAGPGDRPYFQATDRRVYAAFRRSGLPAPYRVVTGSARIRAPGSSGIVAVQLYSRSRVLEHVHVVASAGGPGVWVPQIFAGQGGLHAGGVLRFSGGPVRIAGIYRDLPGSQLMAGVHVPHYWCTWQPLISPTPERQPPPLVFADLPTTLHLVGNISAAWYAPIDVDRLSTPRAALVAGRARSAYRRVGTDISPADPISSTGLAGMVDDARRTGRGLHGPLTAVAAAGMLAGVVLLAGAGGFWAVRRRPELRLLTTRGVGPGAVAGKALLEMLPAGLLGAAVGWVGSIGLVRGLGPSGLLDPGAGPAAAGAAGVAGAGGLVVAALAGAAVSTYRPARLGRRLGLALAGGVVAAALAAAVVTERWLASDGATRVGEHDIVAVGWLVVAFPLLGLAATLPVAALLFGGASRRVGRRSGRWSVAGFLAGRGLSARAVAAGALAGLVALPIGIFGYSYSLTRTVQDGVRSKALTYDGAEHALGTGAPIASQVDTHGAGTVVSVIDGGAAVGSTTVDVLGVQPASFDRYAYRGGAPRQLRTGSPVPAILVNSDRLRGDRLQLRNTTLRFQVVARAATFPGLRDQHSPLLVVDREALRHVDPYVNRNEEVWTSNADEPAVLAALGAHHIPIVYESAPSNFVNATALAPVTWGFGYLAALGGLVGLLAISALVTATAARVRRRANAYHLLRRMRLSGGAHTTAIAVELAVVVAAGFVAGGAIAFGLVALVYRTLDLNSAYPPAAPLVLPVGPLGIALAVAAGAVVGIASWAHWAARRSDPAEVLRLD